MREIQFTEVGSLEWSNSMAEVVIKFKNRMKEKEKMKKKKERDKVLKKGGKI